MGEKRKGQLQMSFGVIFSIIIIIATLAVAGYIIVKFLNIGQNIECKVFYQDLQKKIDESWSSNGGVSYLFSGYAPDTTQKICFGNVSQQSLSDGEILSTISTYANEDDNLFFYPISSCGDSAFAYTLKHIKTDSFFCVEKLKGKASVRITKERLDSLVKLSE